MWIVLSVASLVICASANDLPSKILDICEILPKDSVILEPDSCTNWIKCPRSDDGYDYEEGSCLPGLYFDKNLIKCRPQNEVKCPFESSNQNHFPNLCLQQPDGTFIASPNSCNEFIYCKDSIAHTSRCPQDLVFNPNRNSCDYAQDYDCKNTKPNYVDKECLLISEKIYFADRYQCNGFHKCHLGEIRNYTCNQSTTFDYASGKCLPYERSTCLADKENGNPLGRICGTMKNKITGYIPDGKTCSGYYHCANIEGSVDRNPIWNKCSDGRFFDANTLSCRDRTAVKCIHDRCEGMDNKYVNIAGDCKAYAHCKNNVRITEGKCPNQYYFDERSQGCTPQKIQYVACS